MSKRIRTVRPCRGPRGQLFKSRFNAPALCPGGLVVASGPPHEARRFLPDPQSPPDNRARSCVPGRRTVRATPPQRHPRRRACERARAHFRPTVRQSARRTSATRPGTCERAPTGRHETARTPNSDNVVSSKGSTSYTNKWSKEAGAESAR